jgi:type VI secretion system protein ImpL
MISPFKSDLANRLLHVALYGIGFSSVAAVVWLAGPLIEIGGYRPLESYIVREMVVLIAGAALVSVGSFRFYRRQKGTAEIAKALSGEGEAAEASDADVLKDKMKDALATLKAASGGKASFLYDLPWYLMIGPPGSGKTTALVNSGLKFPLSRGATPAAVAGVGGTRYCDWWFTEDAVLIDTAGRYTTQDSDAKVDRQSWFAFLDLLKKSRPRQPINGVMVVISIEDLMTLGAAEVNAHANAIRARLLELHDRLKVDFPVYALFTKGDLVAGFTEFFATLGEEGRRQVWGATFQTADKTRNLVGEVPVEYDALVERMNIELTDRLQEEPVPSARVTLFGLPAQMARLKRPIFDFLNQIFEPTRYHANATLRGFYFTSGTQQGTPIDQLIGALVKTFGAEEVTGYAYSGTGKSYFLTHLIRKVIIGEAAWVSTDSAAVRRARIIKAAAISALVLVSTLAASIWWTSYTRNRALIKDTDEAVAEYRAIAGPLATQNVISDRDFAKVLPALHKLRHLPSGYETREASVPLLASFGLSQHERLRSASEATYRRGLERMFRPRLVYRLEELLEANKGNPSFIYEALKVYLMLGGLQPADRDLILSWARRDWNDNLYPGAANVEGRKALEDHLLAMFDLEEGDPLITLHGPLIQECQAILARLNVAQRAYELLKSQARTYAEDWLPSRHGGPDFALVFEAADGSSVDNIRVPGFYTYAGFHRAFIDRLGGVAEQVRKDLWVLGDAGRQTAVTAQYDSLGPDLLDIYTKDFINTWRQVLAKLRLKRLNADKPKYIALSAISAATSPLKQLLESIRDETALTRDRPGFGSAKPGEAKSGEAKAAETSPLLLKLQERAPGANIEAAFKPFHVLVEGDATRRPIDAVVGNLSEINQNLILVATNPLQTSQANAALQTQVASLRTNATRMPPPFSDMLLGAAGSFEGDVTNSQISQLAQAMGSQVTGICQQIIGSRYPFERRSDREVPLADFGRLFGTGGIMDRFFTQQLQPLVDSSKSQLTWRQDSFARAASPATLREFQRAQQIRDAFFPPGGNMPAISMSVTPPTLAGPGVTAKLEIHGTAVVSQLGINSPVNAAWPGSAPRTALTVGTDLLGAQPSVLERNGAWSLFRMLDAASPVNRGDRIVASFVVGGRELQYQITTGSSVNPFTLSALREFRCPSGL